MPARSAPPPGRRSWLWIAVAATTLPLLRFWTILKTENRRRSWGDVRDHLESAVPFVSREKPAGGVRPSRVGTRPVAPGGALGSETMAAILSRLGTSRPTRERMPRHRLDTPLLLELGREEPSPSAPRAISPISVPPVEVQVNLSRCPLHERDRHHVKRLAPTFAFHRPNRAL
jgi:hypothetical protein